MNANLLSSFFCDPHYGMHRGDTLSECGMVNEREVRAVAGLMFAIGPVLTWLESSARICLGCIIHTWLVRRGVIPTLPSAAKCAGGVCQL